MTDRLAPLDQASAVGTRATGTNTIIQGVWVYDRAVDRDGLERFRTHLGRGLLGRRMERSPFPFGFDRWVADDSSPQIDFSSSERSRADVLDWADACGRVRLDPWAGPAW